MADNTQTSTWTLDTAHSTAGFTVRHLMITNVRGDFRQFTGTLMLDEANLENSNVQVSIDAASIETREPARDEHLRSADFFDVATYPAITFASKKWSKSGAGLSIVGELTMHGVTKEVTLTAEGPTPAIVDPYGRTKTGFEAHTKISRKEFGLTWNVALEAGGVTVSDDVKISLEVQFIKN